MLSRISLSQSLGSYICICPIVTSIYIYALNKSHLAYILSQANNNKPMISLIPLRTYTSESDGLDDSV